MLLNFMLLHPFLPQQKLFKAYDIRGDVRLFSDDFLWALANTLAKQYARSNASEIMIGYDVRLQSREIANFLALACEQQGLTVCWLGQVTTPMMAYMAYQYSGNGMMVTASHSEKHINGIKWLINGESPSSQDIEQLYFSLADEPATLPSQDVYQQLQQALLNRPQIDAFAAYQADMQRALSTIQKTYNTNLTTLNHSNQPLTSKRLVIDCMHGATSIFAKTLFTGLGYDCIMLNDEPNGLFPAGNPDPTETGRLSELSAMVVTYQADLGLAFDGDGDCLMVVTATGAVVTPDHLLYLLATIALDEAPNTQGIEASKSEVIFDVKCSHHLPQLIVARGAIPVMEKTGSSLMRKSLQNKSRNSVFAGELSGHFLFNDGYFVLHDDAMYAAARLLNWLDHQPNSLLDILMALPLSISTADMYLPIDTSEAGQQLVSQLIQLSKNLFSALKQAFNVKQMNTIDGLRLDFARGFGIVRKSNTGNFLTVRFCGDSLDDLYQVQTVFVDLCRSVDTQLAEQVANIQPLTAA